MKITEKAKRDIESILNLSLDSIDVEEDVLLDIKYKNTDLIIRYSLFGMSWNSNIELIGDNWKYPDKNSFLIDEIYHGVKNFKIDSDRNIEGATICYRKPHGNSMLIGVDDNQSMDIIDITFDFDAFEYSVIGEIEDSELPKYENISIN